MSLASYQLLHPAILRIKLEVNITAVSRLRVQRYAFFPIPPNLLVKKCKNIASVAEILYLCAELHLIYIYSMAVEKTRNKLIEVARTLFAKQGIEETTMNDIALASGKGRRTLYTYFKSKDDIYDAVVQDELELMAQKMAEVAQQDMDPEDKLVALIYAHLQAIKEVVQRNGNIRAEFFRDIWRVSLIRQRFDRNEKILLTTVLSEGVEKGLFEIDDLSLMVDIIRYSVRGLEVPFIYGRIADGMPKGLIRGVVHKIIHRSLSKKHNI